MLSLRWLCLRSSVIIGKRCSISRSIKHSRELQQPTFFLEIHPLSLLLGINHISMFLILTFDLFLSNLTIIVIPEHLLRFLSSF